MSRVLKYSHRQLSLSFTDSSARISRPFLLRKDKGYRDTERPREISPHTTFDIVERFLDDSAIPNIIFHPRCVSVDAAAFDILDLASVHPLPAGRSFLCNFYRFFSISDSLSIFSLSFLRCHLMLLFFTRYPTSLVSIRSLLPRSYLDLPSSRISPFSCIYIYLCSSSPWIKLHPGGRTTLVDELAIGRMWCAHVLLASSIAIVPPFIVQLTAQFCIGHRCALFIVSNSSWRHLILVIYLKDTVIAFLF